jgi:hypothetical protein
VSNDDIIKGYKVDTDISDNRLLNRVFKSCVDTVDHTRRRHRRAVVSARYRDFCAGHIVNIGRLWERNRYTQTERSPPGVKLAGSPSSPRLSGPLPFASYLRERRGHRAERLPCAFRAFSWQSPRQPHITTHRPR